MQALLLGSIALFPVTGFAQGDPVRGKKMFQNLGCQTCHTVNGEGGPGGAGSGGEIKAPDLAVHHDGTPFCGCTVELSDGTKVVVDDAYLLESIVKPDAKIVMNHETGRAYPAGKMPARFAHMPQENLDCLVAYIKTLSGLEVAPVPGAASEALDGEVKKDVPLSKAPVWMWGIVGVFGFIVAASSIRGMVRRVPVRWAAGIVLIPVIGVVLGVTWAGFGSGGEERSFEISARQFAYEPSIINVNKGDEVTFSLKSTDVLHGIYIDGYGIKEEIRPGETTTFTFTADKPGKYPFRCADTCGVFHPFMIGNLIVAPNYLFPGSIGLCFGLGLACFVYVARKEEPGVA